LTRSSSKIAYGELSADDPKQKQPDIRMAIKELGWEPKINLRDGLLKTIAYFTENIP
jgi:UDP-glucuronate decarboxylase